jgi:hypothetical protein
MLHIFQWSPMVARPEVTGRKVQAPLEPAPVQLEPAPVQPKPAAVPIGAYSIKQFCLAHALSEAMYFKLKALGLGPDEMEVGRRRIISIEAAARWRAKRETHEPAEI